MTSFLENCYLHYEQFVDSVKNENMLHPPQLRLFSEPGIRPQDRRKTQGSGLGRKTSSPESPLRGAHMLTRI